MLAAAAGVRCVMRRNILCAWDDVSPVPPPSSSRLFDDGGIIYPYANTAPVVALPQSAELNCQNRKWILMRGSLTELLRTAKPRLRSLHNRKCLHPLVLPQTKPLCLAVCIELARVCVVEDVSSNRVKFRALDGATINSQLVVSHNFTLDL